MEFTTEQQAHIDGLIAAEQAKTAALQAEVDKFKQPEETDEQKHIKQLQAELLKTKVASALQSADLTAFADFVSVSEESEIEAEVTKLKDAVSMQKVSASYKPENHRQSDAYSKAEAAGDVIGMLDAKLSKIYK